jgi:serine/threonine-protein kinase
MGVVFEATHLMLSERVAIKLLLPQIGEDRECRSRFFREAQAAARINSVHVARVRDIGELESGEPYIVMDYLDGFNLNTWIEERGALSVEQAAQWMLEACKGLAAAHAAGVIHRDIKASNLFITSTSDGSSVLKILDFGISKLTEAQGMAEATLTGTQASMGSPLTMSPEQMLSPRDVDHRTDIWSLGTVLYWCLCGDHPFEAESLPQLCVLVLEAEVVPLQTRRPDLPAPLLDTVARCLRKLPADRYADVAELAQALAPFAEAGGQAAADQCRRILDQRRADASGSPPTQASSTASLGEHSTQRAVPSPRPSGARDEASSGTAPTSETRAKALADVPTSVPARVPPIPLSESTHRAAMTFSSARQEATRSTPAGRRALWLALAGGLVLVLGALALRNGGRTKAPANPMPATSQSASGPPAENTPRPSATAQAPVAPSGSSSASSGDASANQAVAPGSGVAASTVPRTPTAKRPTRQSAKADVPLPTIDPFAQRK